ncbi:hypothetical protein FQN55_008568 [Onygenales sp. PD_40]|nr:hypothetical protein FQN55_008568 [Onygenales sp. PD_40]
MSRPGLATFTSFESQRSPPTPTLIKHNPLYDPNNNSINNSTNSTHTTQPNNASFPSPTLTNPDMILPYEGERECSTPSPPFHPLQLPSPDHPSYRRSSVQAQNGMHVSSAGIGVAVSLPPTLATASGPTVHHQPVKNPPPPRNNWVFEGHEIRPPLSDIGEEESPPRARWSGSEGGNVRDGGIERMVLDSSPVLKPQQWRDHRDLGYEGDGDRGYADEDCDDDAASCSASSSTISAPTEILERWEEFAADRGEHAKEGGSEDMAEREGGHREIEHGMQEQTTMDAEMERNNMAAIKEEDGETDDEIPSAMLSKEAERILENAKKRLTHMEGNLNRARTSFRMTPSPSLLLSGTIALNARQSAGITGRSYSMIGERRAQTSLAGALMRQRVSQDLSANGTHSRGFSDVSIQNNMGNIRDGKPQFRSFSALGSTNASGYGANDGSPKHDRFESRAAYQPSVSTFNYIPEDRAEPVISSHNSVSQPASPSSKTNSPRQNAYEQLSGSSGHARANHIPKISSVEEFNAAYPASAPSRSQSQLHVRGLQDQMQDLRSKISTLKVQAQEDNLRRRSLQSLRTPSPFTAAEQWYTSAHDHHDTNGKVADDHWASQPDDGNNDEDEEHHESPREQSPESVLGNVLAEDQQSIADSHYEDADEEFDYDDIDRVALAEILNEPLDSPISGDEDELFQDFPPMPPVPEGTRHEDREDAFDYEHFFLHSALGNYSRSKARQRRQSYDSTGSVETTRPASQGSVYTSPRGRAHVRNNSADSISTAATFATATEGMEDDDEYSGDEIDNALYWNGNGSGGIYQYQNNNSRHSHGHSRQTTVLASPASPTLATSPQSAASTPRAKHSRHSRHASSSSTATRTQSPPPLPAPTTIISSLIASAASQLTPPSAAPAPAEQDSSLLGADDMRLMEGLLQSLGTVALQLQLSTARADKRASADERSSLLFRRRLDAARRVLEGELDA